MFQDNYSESLYSSLPQVEEDMADNESFSSFVESNPWQTIGFGLSMREDLLNKKGQTLNILDKLEDKKPLPSNENNNSWVIQRKCNELFKKVSNDFDNSVGIKIKDFFSSINHNVQNAKFKALNTTSAFKDKVSNSLNSVFKQLFHLNIGKSDKEIKPLNNNKSHSVKDWNKNINNEESISASIKKIFG